MRNEIQVLEKFFATNKISTEYQKETDQLLFGLHNQDKDIPVFVKPISQGLLLQFVAFFPYPVTKAGLTDTYRYLHALNKDLDVPGFCYDIWKGLRGSDIPLVHYVAPTVWAWRPDRAKKFAAELDYLMTLLPFEPPYFEKEGLFLEVCF